MLEGRHRTTGMDADHGPSRDLPWENLLPAPVAGGRTRPTYLSGAGRSLGPALGAVTARWWPVRENVEHWLDWNHEHSVRAAGRFLPRCFGGNLGCWLAGSITLRDFGRTPRTSATAGTAARPGLRICRNGWDAAVATGRSMHHRLAFVRTIRTNRVTSSRRGVIAARALGREPRASCRVARRAVYPHEGLCASRTLRPTRLHDSTCTAAVRERCLAIIRIPVTEFMWGVLKRDFSDPVHRSLLSRRLRAVVRPSDLAIR